MDWIYLAWATLCAALTCVVWWPPKGRAGFLGFTVGWLYGELPLHHIALQVAVALGFVALAGIDSPAARAGIALSALSWAALLAHWATSFGTASRGESCLVEGLGGEYPERVAPALRARFRQELDWSRVLWPFSPRARRRVRRVRSVPFAEAGGRPLKLDVYTPPGEGAGRPVLLQIHGGGWVLGSKNEQALPLIYHMAERGWICVSTSYRLSPAATFPDHLIDCKRALAWIRQNIAEYGGDPDFVVATGGSAGGHLCALLALTAGDPEYQPGFEAVDTSLQGCVPFYGVFDWTRRTPRPQQQPLAQLLERSVMKTSLERDPEAYRRASPIWRVHSGAPPFLVIHSGSDSLVAVEDARDFAEQLRQHSAAPVAYLEVERAQHAFDVFDGVRTQHAVNTVERFCAWVQSDALARPAHEPSRPRRARPAQLGRVAPASR